MDFNLARRSVHLAPVDPISWTYEAVFENAKDCLIVCDSASGRILALNQKARTLLGYAQSEVEGLTLADIHPPEVYKSCQAVFAKLFTEGEVYFNMLYLRKDASVFPAEVSASYFEVNGRQIVQGIARDITARQQSEKLLKQTIEKERLIYSLELRMSLAKERLINAIALRIRESLDLNTCLQTTVDEILQFLRADRVLIYTFNTDGSGYVPVESVSPNYTSLLNQTITDPCVSENYAEIFRQGEPRVVPDIYQASYTAEKLLFLQQLQIRAKLIVPVFLDNRLWGLLMVHQCRAIRKWKDSEVDLLQKLAVQVAIAIRQADLFHQTRTELAERMRMTQALEQARDEALAAAKVKSEFLAVMSHEIRTPMNGVIGMTNLLLDTPLNAEQRHYVETVRNCGNALLGLINDILDMSKIESNKLELEAETFSLRCCVNEAINLLQAKADEKQLYLTYYVASDVPSRVTGDAARLQQILVNLISNAIKFTTVGSVIVSVLSVEPTEISNEPAYRLTFSVRDTGIGIPRNRLNRLFKLFSQVDSSISRQYGGTGLGLAISQRLCEMMGGRIWVDSQVGKGSCFYFTVCMHLPEPEESTASQSAVVSSTAIANTHLAARLPLKILVAEDNLVNQQLVRQWLQKIGYQAVLVNNGQEVLAALQQQTYDLILMDVQMPKMDGISATQQIHQRWPDGERPKIIAMTANAMKGDREICLSAGMDAYLSKPVQIQDLISTIEQCCSTQEQSVAEPSSAQATSQQLLDPQRLEATAQPLGGLTQSWLRPFLKLYVEQGTDLLNQLSEASWHQDYETITYAAHTLKSSSAALGLITLSEYCQQIEDLGQQPSFTSIEAIAPLISRLEATFTLSVQALKQFMKTIPTEHIAP